MTLHHQQPRRRGSVLPLTVLTLVAMCGFVALSIDLGLIAVAKTQCQTSADAAAMAGARALDGTSGQNLGSTSTPGTSMYIAMNTATTNLVLNSAIPASNVTLTYGAWHYDTGAQQFVPNFPPVSPDNYNLVQAQVSYSLQTSFAGVFKYINPSFNSIINVQAVSQAAHRPRDVAIVLDYSGSMNNESDLWNCESYLDNGSEATTLNGYNFPASGNPAWTSNNTDTVYPQFGPYAGTSATAQSTNGNDYSDYLSNPNLLCPAAVNGNALYGNNMIGKSNTMHDLTTAQGVPSMTTDFWQNARGASAVAAFTSAGAGDSTGWVAGDKYLHVGNIASKPYAMNVNDIVNAGLGINMNVYNSSWETQGYKFYTGNAFKGYIEGPGYWGKTFVIWPPDPSAASAAATSGGWAPSGANDWRRNFFLTSTGAQFPSTGNSINTTLFQDGSGNSNNNGIGYNDPSGNYEINYKAILAWITSCGPNPFPTTLRSGNVQIYGSIPTDVPASAYTHSNLNSQITNPDQRFWKEYIDWTLGVWRDPTGSIQHTFTSTCSIGPDFRYDSTGTITTPGTVVLNAQPAAFGGHTQYMNYLDNPWRPRHRCWFGPGTMIQFMMDCGYLPGTTHDISMFPMKQGIGGALTDVQNNHPNDLVAMLLFARPVYGNDPPGCGGFNVPQYNLNNSYASMITSIWVPPGSGSLSSDVVLYSAAAETIPSAHGDFDSNTATSFGLMQAYNQFSSNQSALVNQVGMGGTGTVTVGGLGRVGATRLVILETDGMANEDSQPQGGTNGITNSGANNSYYNIRPADTVNGAGYSQTNLLTAAEAVCNKTDSSYAYTVPSGAPTPPNVPGYATVSKPVIIQCIVFGAIFETPCSAQTSAIPLMQSISTIGGTTFPSSSTDAANGYKWCIGTLQQRQQKLQQAFINILDSSVPVSLIE